MLILRLNNFFRCLDFRLVYSVVNLSKQKTQQKKKNERQRAVFAFHVIKTIAEAPIQNEKDITEPSLREKLIELSIDSPYFTYTEENRNSVIDIFTKGIPLNQNVFRQSRINLGKEIYNPNNSEAFVFCPNLLVTRLMFAQLWKANCSILTLGGYGISKTISTVFFYHLSSIVNQYLYNAFSDQEQKIKLQELRKHKLIQNVPKFFYWNISPQKDLRKMRNIEKSLLQQATQLSRYQKNQLENLLKYNANIEQFDKFVELLNYFYSSKNIQTKVAIDQINFVVGLMKRWNDFYKLNINQYKKKTQELKTLLSKQQDVSPSIAKKNQILQQQILKQRIIWKSKQELQMKPAIQITQIIHSLSILGRFNVYNSSLHIEKDLLAINKNSNFNILTLGLEGQDQLKRVRIKFSQYLKQQWAFNDFYQYFWFQIEKRLFAKGFSEEKVLKLKTTFYEKVKIKDLQKKIPRYIRFLNIRQNFQKNFSLLNFNQNSQDKIILMKFDQIIESLSIYAHQRCVDKIVQFIKKGTDEESLQKKEFIQRLFSLALTTNEDSKNKEMQFTIKQLETKSTKGQVSKYLLSSHYNQQLLPIECNENNPFEPKINFEWTPTEFLSIGWGSIFKGLKETNDIQITDDEINTYFLQLTGKFGYIFQHHLIEVLKSTGVILQYKIYEEMKEKTFKSLQNIIYIYGKQNFLHFFPKQSQLREKKKSKQQQNIYKTIKDYQQQDKKEKYKNFNGKIWINLGNLFQMAMKNPGKYYVGFPEQFNKKKWLHCQNNPSIDWVIVRYDSFRKIFLIQSFDVTITLTKRVIEQKISKAENMLLQISKGYNDQTQFSTDQKIRYPMRQPCSNFQIVHTILCYQKMTQQPIQVSQNPKIAIKFTSIEDLNVIQCDKKTAHKLFQKIKLLHLNSPDVKNKLQDIYFEKQKK